MLCLDLPPPPPPSIRKDRSAPSPSVHPLPLPPLTRVRMHLFLLLITFAILSYCFLSSPYPTLELLPLLLSMLTYLPGWLISWFVALVLITGLC